jgi:hypothetical protein
LSITVRYYLALKNTTVYVMGTCSNTVQSSGTLQSTNTGVLLSNHWIEYCCTWYCSTSDRSFFQKITIASTVPGTRYQVPVLNHITCDSAPVFLHTRKKNLESVMSVQGRQEAICLSCSSLFKQTKKPEQHFPSGSNSGDC